MNIHSKMSIKQKIYHSLISIINTEGFHNTPVSKIASQAEISPGSIYNYFKNKDDIIQSLYVSIYSEIEEIIISNSDSGGSPKDQFLTYWLEIYRFFIKNIEKYGYIKQFENSPFYNNEMIEESRNVFKPLMYYIQDGINNGDFRDTDPLYLMLILKANIYTAVDLSIEGLVHRDGLEDIIDITWRGMIE